VFAVFRTECLCVFLV